jgi:hypothetical protein
LGRGENEQFGEILHPEFDGGWVLVDKWGDEVHSMEKGGSGIGVGLLWFIMV